MTGPQTISMLALLLAFLVACFSAPIGLIVLLMAAFLLTPTLFAIGAYVKRLRR